MVGYWWSGFAVGGPEGVWLAPMDRLLHFFREYPAIAGIAFFILISTFLATVLGSAMLKAGASLKPLVFIFGFFAIVGGPQGAVHLLDALAHFRSSNASPEPEAPNVVTEEGGRAPLPSPVPWKMVFGPDADPSLIVDAKVGLGHIVGDATEAKVSFRSNGETTVAARFASPQESHAALERYRDFFKLVTEAGSDGAGLTGRRYQGGGDWSHVMTVANELYAWTGATREIVETRRRSALGTPADPGTAAGPSKRIVSTRLAQNTPVMIAFLVINLVLAVGWFFKGSTWAARVPAVAVAHPLDATTLRSRLMALDSDSTPMQVTSKPDGSLEVMWRYADARWLSMMSAHQLKRAHKLVLFFDPAERKVRVREYLSAFDGSAGRDGVRLDWKLSTGIQFFAVEHVRVMGAQLDTDGVPTGELSKAWTFDLQQLKAPFITATTEAGWSWQPLTWNAPKALHWLTE